MERFRQFAQLLSPALRRVRPALALCLAAWLLQHPGAGHAAETWPSVALPDNVHTFAIGDELVVGGTPMRLRGFASEAGPVELAKQFRKTLGSPLVENKQAQGTMLGRALGDHYLTVQFTPAARGSRGWIALTRVRTTYGEQEELRAEMERLVSQLPSGSRIVSHTRSNDGGRQATHLLVMNEASEEFNAARIRTMMQGDGLHLTKELVANARAGESPGGRTLVFAGAGREAMARVFQEESGRTLVVLNQAATRAGQK